MNASSLANLYKAFCFFHEHADNRVTRAVELAKAEARAKALGLEVTWDDEDLPWDGDCPAPAIHQRATVLNPRYPNASTSQLCVRFPYHDGPDGRPVRHAMVLAALGGIGLESWSDPYVRVVEAELFAEALDALDEENDRVATAQAYALAARATFAGVSP